MGGDAGNTAVNLDGMLLDNVAGALRAVVAPSETGKPAQPKYEIRQYSDLGGFIIVLAPNGSVIASIRCSNGTGEAMPITTTHFPDFLNDFERALEQMGRRLAIETPTSHPTNGFGKKDNIYEALAGVPLGAGESQYRS